jgi:hypothetical protein
MSDLAGIPVISNDYATVGRILRFEDPRTGRLEIHAHPLDVIAFKHPRDPLARLDEAMAWIVARAHRRLDAAARRLDPEPDDSGATP